MSSPLLSAFSICTWHVIVANLGHLLVVLLNELDISLRSTFFMTILLSCSEFFVSETGE